MMLLKTTMAVCGLALLGSMAAPVAEADAWNRKTVITFSGPVEIPGVHLAGWGVLPAGTYVFKVLDSQSDRHIVQISNKEETKVYATILAIPNYRLKATDKTVMTFRERPAGQPEALRAWFYPGRNWGEEFVYPKAKALALAKATNMPVLFTPAELPAEVTEPIKTADAPVVVELKRAPIMAVTPAGEEVQLAQVVTPPPAAEMQETPILARTDTATLPETATSLGTMALIGLVALVGAIALRSTPSRTR
jgi:hypothetical protein